MVANLSGQMQVALQRATNYANRKIGARTDANMEAWSNCYNYHLDGLLECLAERESLRSILEKHEKLKEIPKPSPSVTDIMDDATGGTTGLDDLV